MNLSSALWCPGCHISCFCGNSAVLNLLGALCLQKCGIQAGQNMNFSCSSAVLVESHLWLMVQRPWRGSLSGQCSRSSISSADTKFLCRDGGYRGTDLIQCNKTGLDLETPPFPGSAVPPSWKLPDPKMHRGLAFVAQIHRIMYPVPKASLEILIYCAFSGLNPERIMLVDVRSWRV